MLQKPNCFSRKCIYFNGAKYMGRDEKTEILHCLAFPSGIPNQIAYGDNKHSEPLKGQTNDIIYKKRENEKDD